MNDTPSDPPLHDLDPVGRFTDRAEDYVRYRPDYPAAAWDRVLEGYPDLTAVRAVDVGAGTGISARQLAERGPTVRALEPNAAMRAAAASHPRITWQSGSAEATGLPDGTADVVVCAQSFHWFRATEAIREFHRVLAAGGRLALLWNSRDRSDPATREFIEAIHAVNGEHPVERLPFDPRVVHETGAFDPPTLHRVPNAQRLDRDGLRGRATSASYVPREGERMRRLFALLDAVHERHHDADGSVTLRYNTEVWIAHRRDTR